MVTESDNTMELDIVGKSRMISTVFLIYIFTHQQNCLLCGRLLQRCSEEGK